MTVAVEATNAKRCRNIVLPTRLRVDTAGFKNMNLKLRLPSKEVRAVPHLHGLGGGLLGPRAVYSAVAAAVQLRVI